MNKIICRKYAYPELRFVCPAVICVSRTQVMIIVSTSPMGEYANCSIKLQGHIDKEFLEKMQELSRVNKRAYEYLMRVGPY